MVLFSFESISFIGFLRSYNGTMKVKTLAQYLTGSKCLINGRSTLIGFCFINITLIW